MNSQAYTIVEAMIFLAVSSVLFLLVVTTISGQQAKTEFTQSVTDFESLLLDVANDVSTGYYNNSNDFSCTPNVATGPTINNVGAGGGNLGANSGCILVGQVLRFTTDSAIITRYPLAGNQKDILGKEVGNVSSTRPVAITNAQTTDVLHYGAVVGKVTYDTGAAPVTLPSNGGAAIVTTFGAYGSSGTDLTPSDISADLFALTNATPPAVNVLAWAATPKNPLNGIKICLKDGANPTKHADVILGGNGRQLTSKVNYGTGNCT